jgi:NDP-sugar pyrophosphorylase family protein
MKNNLSTILLLGGQGTRLRSVIDDRPKVMAPINGKPFLEILLDELIKFDIEKVVLSTGYKSEYIEKELGKKYKHLNLLYSKEDEPRGTAGGVSLASTMLDSDNYLIMNGDNFIEFDLPDFYKFHTNNSNDITILVKHVSELGRYGSVSCDNLMKVKEFKEKDASVKSGFINCGVYLFNSSIIDFLPNKIPSSLEIDFFPNILNKNFFAFETKGRHLDIGTPESYEVAQSFFN